QTQAELWIFAHIMERDDVRMTHPRGSSRFLAHAVKQRLVLFRWDLQVVTQELDRDTAIEHWVVREQHAAHRATTQQALDAVAADLRGQAALSGVHCQSCL